VCVLASTALGCASVTVRHIKAPALQRPWQSSVVETSELSPRTLQTLHQWDLDHLYRSKPEEAFARLQARVVESPEPDQLYALAEMSYVLGQKAERWRKPNAIRFYYLSAGYAYHYLFGKECNASAKNAEGFPEVAHGPGSPPPFFDPRFRLACDLYNAGLGKCIRAAQRIGRLDPGLQLHLPTEDGLGFNLLVAHHGFAWRSEEFGPMLFCADYEVNGLENQYRDYGLGVPMIGTRLPVGPAPVHALYPEDINFPVTAFFRFEGSVADLTACRCGRLELYNPLAVQAIEIQGHNVPLETDLTTPLAYFLAHTDLNSVPYEGFLRPDKIQKRTGIYMFEPYQPGKIPVLMVHGLLSSPATWAPMFNDLRADPELRNRFQFWFYLYPTADPYLATAADLRHTLNQLRTELDPDHRDAALDHMVMVGHSMGGLVSKLLTVDSADDFWCMLSAEPFDSVKASPDTLAQLRQIYFFDRQSYVRRVIFLGTPHHGSKLSPSPPARLLDQFARLPGDLVRAAGDVAKEDPKFYAGLREDLLPTSIDLLAPGAPALELLAYKPAPQGTHYHSIIGVVPHLNYVQRALLPGGHSREGTDGVVPYSSAHLDKVDSEQIVPADHLNVHCHPLAVIEVRRILLEHLREADGK
jgi:pimeloyl-ACP methyl ester carboxylesterase